MARNNEPALRRKTPLLICSMRTEIPYPCIGSSANVFRMSMSRVPWTRSLGLSGIKRSPLATKRSIRLFYWLSRGARSESIGSGQAAIQRRGYAFAEAGHAQGGEDACEDIHGVVGAQDEDGSDFKADQRNGADREPLPMEAGELYCSENGNGGVTGKEKVVRDMIGHQKGRKSGVVPDHS